jgi:alcohol dehydrogenase
LGVDSVELPVDVKEDIWNLIAKEWLHPDFAQLKQAIVKDVGLEQLSEAFDAVLAGQHSGRYVVKI